MLDIGSQFAIDSLTIQWLVAVTFVGAGIVKGFVGLGLPTIAMGILGSCMPPAQAAALLIVPSLATNVMQMLAGTGLIQTLRRFWSLQIGIFFGTIWCPVGLATLDMKVASGGLGIALTIYSLLGLASIQASIPVRRQKFLSPLVGAVTGAVAAATGVFVFPAVPYLQGLFLSKEQLIQTLGLSFTVSTLALLWRLSSDGAITALVSTVNWALFLPLLAALFGMSIGQTMRSRFSDKGFRRAFFSGLLLIGIHLLLKGIWF